MTPARPLHRFRAGVILALFAMAVLGAASMGWWYARESPPHHGPIVLVSLSGVSAPRVAAYGGTGLDTPATDAVARDAVVFERAYTHSLQLVPATTSLISGQLPVEHGVRDDAGFSLRAEANTVAELLSRRGFSTGAALSSFLLRRATGLAQGFSYFDVERTESIQGQTVVIERDAVETVEAAERWIASLGSQRYFLFVQLGGASADRALGRLTSALRARGQYDEATIMVVGDRGDVSSGLHLDERSLRVPLVVKQPGSAGAGRRISTPVQHIDLAPTMLDLVRAPVPRSLRGRSLRAVLDGDADGVPSEPIYSESLAARFRFGGQPLFALTDGHQRYVRGVTTELVRLGPAPNDAPFRPADEARLQAALDDLVGSAPLPTPARIEAADEHRYALAGLLASVHAPTAPPPDLTADQQSALAVAHREAASLVGQRNYPAGIRALRTIARDFPALATVHYQLGSVLARSGRLEEAIAEFRASRELQPDASETARALADTLLRAGELDGAREQAELAVALSERTDSADIQALAHETAGRVALAQKDVDGALLHAERAEAADGALPVTALVRGRVAFESGDYEAALSALQPAVDDEGQSAIPDLRWYLGEALVRLERYEEAERYLREEIEQFPHHFGAYSSLAALYRATGRETELDALLSDLIEDTPTPEGYAAAARVWTSLEEPGRAETLRAEARGRFKGDPSLALLRGGRR